MVGDEGKGEPSALPITAEPSVVPAHNGHADLDYNKHATAHQGIVHNVRHAAIIMDGNGRWAKKRHLPRAMGHKAGVEAVRRTIRAMKDFGLEALTLYAFSSENWKRSEEEVSDLMGLLRFYIKQDVEELVTNNIRLHVIGNYKAMAPDIVKMIDTVLERTAHNTGTTLAVALNYGGQDEILRAARGLAQKAADGIILPDEIAEEHITQALDTASLPPLDLIIRTSGERRLSNFLLWQAAYAELYFTDILWPDFTGEHLQDALLDFAKRDRRYGGR